MTNTQAGCYVRFLHAIPGTLELDLFINDEAVAKKFSYIDCTEYFSAYPGIYKLTLCPAGKKETVLMDEHLEINEKSVCTIALVGTVEQPGFDLIYHKKMLTDKAADKNKAHVRFINLSPLCTKYHISLNDAVMALDVSYREVSETLAVDPATYSAKAIDTVTARTALEDPRIILKAGKMYGCYLVGLEKGTPGMQILMLPENPLTNY